MSRKTRSTSARAAKQRRQSKALAGRRAQRSQIEFAHATAALDEALAAGSLQMLCPDGQVRELTVERMWAHIEADLAGDGEPPLGDYEAFRWVARVDLESGALWLRPDGLWESDEDYFTDRQADQ